MHSIMWNNLKEIKPDDKDIKSKFLIYWIFSKSESEGYAIATYFGGGLFSANNKYYDARHVVYWAYLNKPDVTYA